MMSEYFIYIFKILSLCCKNVFSNILYPIQSFKFFFEFWSSSNFLSEGKRVITYNSSKTSAHQIKFRLKRLKTTAFCTSYQKISGILFIFDTKTLIYLQHFCYISDIHLLCVLWNGIWTILNLHISISDTRNNEFSQTASIY